MSAPARNVMSKAADGPLGDALLTGSAPVSAAAAEALVARHYGWSATARPLPGEKDCNFLVRDRNGCGALLRIVHPAEDRAVTAMQTAAMLHVARRDPAVPVQRVVATTDGRHEFPASFEGGPDRMVRLVSFIEGVMQRDAPSGARQRENVGAALARLQLALAGFRHPAEDHRLAWDLKHAGGMRPLVAAVPDRGDRALLEGLLDAFDDRVGPRLAALRSQLVHNDLNSDNVVVDAADPAIVRGLLDFGDAVRTAVVIDVAVGATYQLEPGDRPLAGALDFLRGFARVRALETAETEVLFDLILTRLMLRVLIPLWRAGRFPENRTYILRNAPLARQQLALLAALPRPQVAEAIGRACEPSRSA